MANEDADVKKIRKFVAESLESVGALLEFREYNYAEVLIPDKLLDYFDNESYFSLSFDYDVAKQHENSELVTYGSYFLDRVIDMASQMGITCRQHIIDDNVELRNLPQKIKGKIAFMNCRNTFLANSPMIYHYILFNFKVSYISDERIDRIVKILVNLNTNHWDREMQEAIETAFFTDSPHTSFDIEQMHPADDAYKTATATLEELIQPAIQEFSVKIKRRLDDEKNRIMEYYNQADGELKLRRGKLVESGKDEGLKSIDDKLRLSEIERQRRLNEIEEKNALRVSVMLFNASLISQTKIRNKYNIKRGKADRVAYVIWNPILNDVEPLICEICNCETTKVELCANSHLGCTSCVQSCSVCGAHLCTKCGMTECSVCGVPLCGNCGAVCGNCGDVLCEKHIESCTCKEEKRRKTLEKAEKKAREKREAEERAREEHILEYQDIPLQLSESMKKYHGDYVRRNIDALDQAWKQLMIEARSIMIQGENIKARAIFQRLDTEYPENAWVKANLILSYTRRSPSMSSLGTQAIRLAPNTALAHSALAYAHEKNGRYQGAINSYEQAIKLSGNDEADLVINALFRTGKILYDYGNLQGARRKWQMALAIDPRYKPARQALNQL